MEKVARAPKAERKMEWKHDVCTQLQELATPLDYRKVMPEQAYTLGIIAPGQFSLLFSLIRVSAQGNCGEGLTGVVVGGGTGNEFLMKG